MTQNKGALIQVRELLEEIGDMTNNVKSRKAFRLKAIAVLDEFIEGVSDELDQAEKHFEFIVMTYTDDNGDWGVNQHFEAFKSTAKHVLNGVREEK